MNRFGDWNDLGIGIDFGALNKAIPTALHDFLEALVQNISDSQ